MKDEGRARARQAVITAMARREWNPTDLQRGASLDPGTVGDFLNGSRWPRPKTLAKIERAFGWPAGSLGAMELGGPAPDDVPTPSGMQQLQAEGHEADFRRIDEMNISDAEKAVLRATLTALLWPGGRPDAGVDPVRRVATM